MGLVPLPPYPTANRDGVPFELIRFSGALIVGDGGWYQDYEN